MNLHTSTLPVVATVAGLLALAACGGDDTPPPPDSGMPPADIGVADVGQADLGDPDLGSPEDASPEDSGPDDGGPEDGGIRDLGPGTPLTIYDVQDPSRSEHPSPGTVVRLENVRVTAVDTFVEPVAGIAPTGNLWVQEPAGGLWSGLHVYQPTVNPCRGETAIQAGDVVTVIGVVQEFAVPSDTTGETVTELVSAIVHCTTPAALAGPLPEPLAVDVPATLATPATAEPYEGVLVTLANVDALEPPDMFGAFAVSGELLVDDALYAHPATRRDRFLRLTGVMHYVFSRVRLYPRSSADVVLGPPRDLEDLAGTWACADGVDSDADGAVDCADPDCSRNPLCRMSPRRVRVQDLQDPRTAGRPAPGTRVQLVGPLVVTAVDTFVEPAAGMAATGNVFVQDTASASAEYSGIFVFQPTIEGCEGGPLRVGDQVYVAGRYEEYAPGTPPDTSRGTLSEVASAFVACASRGSEPVPTVVPDPAILAGNTPPEMGTGEPYEGVLVEVRGVTVTMPVGMFGEFRVTGDLRVDDDLYRATPAAGTRLSRLVGVLHFQNGVFQLQPRSAADVVVGPDEDDAATCTNGMDDDGDGLTDCDDLDCCGVAACHGALVLSEVVYDATGADDGNEWVELVNVGSGPAQLGCWSIGHGAVNYTYSRMAPLPARRVPAGGCIVVGGPRGCSGPPSNCTVPQDFDPDLLNTAMAGPPGVGLFRDRRVTTTSVPADAVVYGTGTPMLLSPSGMPFTAPSVAGVSAGQSIERFGMPGANTWRQQRTPTPGVCTAVTP